MIFKVLVNINTFNSLSVTANDFNYKNRNAKTLYLSINNHLNMKNFILLLLAVFVFTNLSAQQAKLSNLLVEFETAVKWNAVDPKWKDRRTNWINSVKAANTPAAMGKLLAEFETYVTWDAVDKRWEGARDKWINACMKPASYSVVAKLMLEFESYTKWEGVTEDWKRRRDGLVKEANSL